MRGREKKKGAEGKRKKGACVCARARALAASGTSCLINESSAMIALRWKRARFPPKNGVRARRARTPESRVRRCVTNPADLLLQD